MVEVTKEDANNYCRVLTALGMEEEGDPVAEIKRFLAENRALRNRLVSEIRKTEPGCYETATASAEAQMNEYLDAFHAAMDRRSEAPVTTEPGRPPASDLSE